MNKRAICFTALLFSLVIASASEIKIAPLAVYDGDGNKTEAPYNPSKAIHDELEKHWFGGLINFSHISESKYGIPVTIIDAHKICASERADYLIYGYLKKNESSWLCEVKLYDANGKKIIKEFFAGDSIDHYDRLINVLCQNILFGIEEITGLNKDELRQKKTRPMELRIPVSLFYWNPVDSNWGDKILGIAGVNAGIELYPPQPVIVSNEKLIDFSARFNLSWNIGINKKNTYPLVINTMAISLPVLLHVHFNERHSLYGGFGLAYNIELMSIKPKYENEKFLYQNVFSFETIAGYEFDINDKARLFAEMAFDFHLLGDGFVSVKPCLGASFYIFKERR
ncbi:MAG: hypothetical protein PUD17_06785 [Treponema sp.]|uniref:hypothetical protein n=1 Tax=Treponema sp. TaxID=166 RepID=UPI00298E5462|nr:hypothetical protein [Treponema sp.]MDD5811790.1 hypothetical protein [Treponema sp.]